MSIAHASAMIPAAYADPVRTVGRTYSGTSTFIGKGAVTANCTLNHETNGDLTLTANDVPAGTPNSDEWNVNNPSATGADFEVRATLTAGVTPTLGNMVIGTWHRLNAQRTIGNTNTSSSASTVTSTVTFDYRLFAGGLVIHTTPGVVLNAVVV